MVREDLEGEGDQQASKSFGDPKTRRLAMSPLSH